jgi:hypothetical protein
MSYYPIQKILSKEWTKNGCESAQTYLSISSLSWFVEKNFLKSNPGHCAEHLSHQNIA